MNEGGPSSDMYTGEIAPRGDKCILSNKEGVRAVLAVWVIPSAEKYDWRLSSTVRAECGRESYESESTSKSVMLPQGAGERRCLAINPMGICKASADMDRVLPTD